MMAELIDTLASWRGMQALFLFLVVFGFAPGVVLRTVLLLYPKNDSRRKELIAELYGVPWFKRPLWVAEQFELALYEGLGPRISTYWHGRSIPRVTTAIATALVIAFYVADLLAKSATPITQAIARNGAASAEFHMNSSEFLLRDNRADGLSAILVYKVNGQILPPRFNTSGTQNPPRSFPVPLISNGNIEFRVCVGEYAEISIREDTCSDWTRVPSTI